MYDFAPHDLTTPTSHSPFVLSASSTYASGAYLYTALDGTSYNYIVWDTSDRWIKLDVGAGNTFKLLQYDIQVNTVPEPLRAMKDWTMQGSNDNTTWTTIDTVTGETSWASGERRTYVCDDTSTAYRYFKIVVTDNNGDATYTQLAELYLYTSIDPVAGFPHNGILDNFNRANGSLGANWTNDSAWGGTAPLISSNKAVMQIDLGGGGDSEATWNTAFGEDCEAYLTLASGHGIYSFAALFVRLTDRSTFANYYYLSVYDADGTGTKTGVYLGKTQAGSYSQLYYTELTHTFATVGDKYGIAVIGNTIELYNNYSGSWNCIEVIRDLSPITGSGYIGFEIGNGSSVASGIDDFGGGVIAGIPVADFTGTPTSGAAPLTVNFTNISTGTYSTSSWDFGDGGTSSATNPSHVYTLAGTYTVELTISGDLGTDTKTLTDYINVADVATVANFSGTPRTGGVPLTVVFTDLSTGTALSAWSWDFGDGSTSTSQNPTHTYLTSGSHTVSLTTTGSLNSSTETKVDYIINFDAPVANFVAHPTEGYPGYGGGSGTLITFDNLSSGSISTFQLWFGDGSYAFITTPVTSVSKVYPAPGNYSVALQVVGPGGTGYLERLEYIHIHLIPPVSPSWPTEPAYHISGTINGNDIGGYVRSLRRVGHLCAPGMHATLIMSPDWPHGSNPGKMVFLYENDLQVMKGWIVKSTRSRPSMEWIIEIDDEYTLLVSTFMDQQEVTIAGHDTSYWVEYIMSHCGADFHINGTPAPVPAGVQIGLRPASEALKDILAYASWYAWPDKNGVIQVGSFDRSISGRTITDFTKFEYEVSDEMTRNVIKVYGTGRIFAKSVKAIPRLTPDRIAVVGSPMIQSNAEAQRVGDYMLKELGDYTRLIHGTIPGNPKLKVGNVVTMTHLIDGHRYSVTDTITSLESNYDINSGYEMEVTVGERCPRIAGFSQKVPYVYAGLNGNGVYVSRDKGVHWSAMNTGLPGADLDNAAPGSSVVSRIAGDSYGKALAIVNGDLWYETALNWERVTGVSGTPKAVGSLGGMDCFAVLTGSAVYFSIPSSGSTPPDDPTVSSGSILGWNPVQLTTVDPISGSTLYGRGIDLYSKTGTAYVNAVTSSGSSSETSGSADLGYVLGSISTVYCGTLVSSGGIWVDRPDDFPFIHWLDATGLGATAAFGFIASDETYQNKTQVIKVDGSGALPFGHSEIDVTIISNGNPSQATIQYRSSSVVIPGMTVGDTLPEFDAFGTLSYDDRGCGGLPIPPVTATIGTGSGDQYMPLPAYFKVIYNGLSSVAPGCLYTGPNNNGYDVIVSGIRWIPASGSPITLYPQSSGSYNLYTVSEGGSILVSEIPYASNTADRLYVSDDGEVFIYNTDNRLLVSENFGSTWHQAFPDSGMARVAAVTRAAPPATQGDTSGSITTGSYVTYIGGVTSGSTTALRIQFAPEVSSGWTIPHSDPPSGFIVHDAIWSEISTGTILVGGEDPTTRMFKYDAAPPFDGGTSWSVVGGELPAGAASNVLDLEAGE